MRTSRWNDFFVTTPWLQDHLDDPAIRLVDSRGPRDFRGEVGRGQRKGRIPGAVNVPIQAFWGARTIPGSPRWSCGRSTRPQG